ncbi:MAG: hypothetical protein ACOYM1_11160 [Methylovulum sp.]|jgi:hypothetical protein
MTENMSITAKLTPYLVPISLVFIMALTRFQHFGDSLHLPDASLAVFFLAGLYHSTVLKRRTVFIALLLIAGMIDFAAIQMGTSAWCISPAYVFLVPTYFVMWRVGQYCRYFQLTSVSSLLKAFVWVALASTAAFFISNMSFYLFSGRYSDMPVMNYLVNSAHYYPAYVGYTLIYAVLGYAAIFISQSFKPAVLRAA